MPELEGTTESTTPEATTEVTTTTEAAADKTFTQDQVNRLLQDRLARQKAQFQDYEELKTKAAEFDKIAEASKTELEKAQERAAQAEEQAREIQERARRTLTDAAITAAASGKFADPSDAAAFIDRAAIEYGEDGAPTNVAALVDAVLEAKPHLAASATRATPVDQGARGATPEVDIMGLSDAEFMARLRGSGVK